MIGSRCVGTTYDLVRPPRRDANAAPDKLWRDLVLKLRRLAEVDCFIAGKL